MAQWGTIGQQRSRKREEDAERYSREQREDPSPEAGEIARTVAVAEWLGIGPNVAAAALRAGDGKIRTDCSLLESVRRAERRLGGRT